MNINRKGWVFLFAACICLALVSTPAAAANEATIAGTVLEGYQIMGDDNQVYDIADDDKGNELGELVEKKVKVTGTIEESDGVKVIKVTAYEVTQE